MIIGRALSSHGGVLVVASSKRHGSAPATLGLLLRARPNIAHCPLLASWLRTLSWCSGALVLPIVASVVVRALPEDQLVVVLVHLGDVVAEQVLVADS